MLGSLIWLVPASRYVTNPFLGIVATVGWVLSAIGFLLAFLGLAMTRLVEVEQNELRKWEQAAEMYKARPWDEDGYLDLLDVMRKLPLLPPES